MQRRIAILGAGPASLWTALTLLERNQDWKITVIEKDPVPGGITSSFKYRDLVFDYGSHRLHPSTRPDILERIRDMLGDDLLCRTRNGRIRLENRFIAFPLNPVDLLLHLPPSFSMGIFRDSLLTPFRKSGAGSFEKVLLAGLGRTISTRFYFPYARKLWGLSPDRLSPVQARKRISSGSIAGMAGKAFSRITGAGGRSNSGFFHYPRHGFGQLAETVADRIQSLGGRIIYNTHVTGIAIPDANRAGSVSAVNGNPEEIPADFIFSTLPVTSLIGMIEPSVHNGIASASGKLSYRSMVFCILELNADRYTPFDAHYFPGTDVCFSRMSEPKNYSTIRSPTGRTGLCFEIPCGTDDTIWNMPDDLVRSMVLEDLKITGLPEPGILSFTVRRKRNVYPVYDLVFQASMNIIEDYLSRQNRLVSLGRQGLFVHDNTNHTIEMGIAAGTCLNEDLTWNEEKWSGFRKEFEKHVVVD